MTEAQKAVKAESSWLRARQKKRDNLQSRLVSVTAPWSALLELSHASQSPDATSQAEAQETCEAECVHSQSSTPVTHFAPNRLPEEDESHSFIEVFAPAVASEAGQVLPKGCIRPRCVHIATTFTIPAASPQAPEGCKYYEAYSHVALLSCQSPQLVMLLSAHCRQSVSHLESSWAPYEGSRGCIS